MGVAFIFPFSSLPLLKLLYIMLKINVPIIKRRKKKMKGKILDLSINLPPLTILRQT